MKVVFTNVTDTRADNPGCHLFGIKRLQTIDYRGERSFYVCLYYDIELRNLIAAVDEPNKLTAANIQPSMAVLTHPGGILSALAGCLLVFDRLELIAEFWQCLEACNEYWR